VAPTFGDFGLGNEAPDKLVWDTCQREQLVLVTANRNFDGPDSLEAAIRASNTPTSFPVFTLSNPDRFLNDRDYANEVADSVLEKLFDMDYHRGAGRLFVP